MKPHPAFKLLSKSILSSLMILCLFLQACDSANVVKIDEKLFQNEIDEQQNLVFTFNKDIYPDSLLHSWDTTTYIQIEPQVSGSFQWTSSNTLIFSPNIGFEPGQVYKATLSPNLLSKNPNKKLKLGGSQTLSFHTAPIKVVSTNSFWTKGSQNANVVVQLNIGFNYETNLKLAASKLQLSSYGKAISFNVVNSGVGKTLAVQFTPQSESDKETDIKIELAKGVTIARSNIETKKDTSFTNTLSSRYKLDILDNEAMHDGTKGNIDVSFSQPVAEENLKDKISIQPKVKFEVNSTENGISISSDDFNPNQTYTIAIAASLKGAYGGAFNSERIVEANFGELEPNISFINNKGRYLSSKGYRNLALNIVQVPEVEVSVVKVYENNILQLFRQGTSWNYEYDENDDYQSFEYYNTAFLGDTVFSKKYSVDKLPKNNAASLLHLDFADKIRGYDGVYVINIASSNQKWVQVSKILSLSDIALIVKQDREKLMVFANSIKNANAISGAKINFVSSNNQVVYTGTTNNEGLCVFDNYKEKLPNAKIAMVTAKKDEEYSFITFYESAIETSRFDIGGRSISSNNLIAWIYAERNLYRPGETINASTILRTESWTVPEQMPVKLKLIMPNGKEFGNRNLMTNAQGSIAASFDIPHTAITGTYTLQALSGNDVLLNTYSISVEDFMPDRIKTSLQLNKEKYTLSDPLITDIKADNLFGTPAANRNYEWELNINKVDFKPKAYSDYNFRVMKSFNFQTVFRTGTTDENGAAKEEYEFKDELAETGLLKGNIRTTVFDETGRPVHRYAQYELLTQDQFIGIKQMDDYVGTNVPLKINLVCLKQDESIGSGNVQVKILRKEWQNVIEETEKKYRYVSKWIEKEISNQTLKIVGNNTIFSFTPTISGEYEMQVSFEGSESYVSQTFYAYGYANTQYSSFEVNNEGNVSIKADKETYSPGERINLLFTTPFEGRMLITVERDKTIEYHFVNTNNKSASLVLNAKDIYLPNVYVSATLFRAMDASDMPLTVAHGYKNIKVEDKQNKLPISLNVKEHSRSKTKQSIYVKTSPNAYVSIAAVDEGILQVKNYISPDPYKYFYQKVALHVNSYNIYPLLLPEYKTTQSSTGGDGANDPMAGRVNPLFVNRVKNVSFWSGILKADASGNVQYDIDVPQFSGAIRVMAVAYKDKAFGSIDNTMTVADPIVVSTALPRFFSPGDKSIMPITLSNTTDKEAIAEISASVQGPLSIEDNKVQKVTIKAKSEARVLYTINANNETGEGKVLVNIKALNEVFTNETDISIRPPASLQKDFVSGIIQAGNSINLSLSNNFMPNSFNGSLLVSNSPLVQFSKNINYLVQYPHGCLEQTVSSAFPQLYYGELATIIGQGKEATMNANYNVQQAIYKIQAMQLPNGSLSYWPGGNYENWWGTVFATHFLIEAKKAGFDINENSLNKQIDYLKFRLKKKEVIEYYYNDDKRKSIAAKEIPYSLYVLALMGKADQSLMNYYKGNLDALSLDGKYLLAATYHISGQADKANQVLPPAFTGEKSVSQFGGSFYSYTRDKAIALNALIDINPKNPQVAELAFQLSEEMRNNPYLNTQENVFSILAMGKIAKSANASNGEINVVANGQKIASTTGLASKVDLKQYLNQTLAINTKGSGQFYYFKEISGISKDGKVKEEDKYLKVRRAYYNRDGVQITNNTFKSNQLIVVKITIEGQYNGEIENVVITDMLPAGLEIENTRLNDLPNLKWVTDIKDKDEPDYLDVRDDRLNLFTSANGKQKTFYYMVRAVSPGTYILGPIQADAMYNGMYRSYHGAGIVKVEQ